MYMEEANSTHEDPPPPHSRLVFAPFEKTFTAQQILFLLLLSFSQGTEARTDTNKSFERWTCSGLTAFFTSFKHTFTNDVFGDALWTNQ